jgi:hypothetical protein
VLDHAHYGWDPNPQPDQPHPSGAPL